MARREALTNDRVREQFLVFGKPVIGPEEIAEVVDSLERGWIGTGPKVGRFERMLEQYVGVPHMRCVASCTAALMLSFKAMDIEPGAEVLVPAMTFVASANAVIHAGATPVLVDVEPVTGLMDLEAAEAAITPKTQAIMVVHLAGRPIDLDRLRALADRHSLKIVEDAAHALGAEWHGRRIGSHGNLAAFSFYATKNITTAEGGAIATPDAAIAERVERLALHGLSLGAWQRYSDPGFKHYEAEELGYKFNLTDIHAAIGLHQLPRLDAWIDARAEIVARYRELLDGLPLTLPLEPTPEMRHAQHLFAVLVDDDAPITRDELATELHRRNIGIGIHYRAVHLHPLYARTYGLRREDFPVASDISERTLSLPLAPDLDENDIADVVSAVRAALG
jgi:dTDP-4-amino-4,6-dideoxygalactose transaminase